MTTEAAAEPTTFTANFEVVITGIRTTTVDGLQNVVKYVEWIMKGTENGQSFELPQKTELNPPDPTNFVPLESITDPSVMVNWVLDTDPRINSIKAHIQLVLNKMVSEATAVSTPLPWAPPPAPEPAPAPVAPT
jgi:hypothetical protein